MSLDVLDAPPPDIITIPADASALEVSCQALDCREPAHWICSWTPCACGRNTFLFCDMHKQKVVEQDGQVCWFCPTKTHFGLTLQTIRSIR